MWAFCATRKNHPLIVARMRSQGIQAQIMPFSLPACTLKSLPFTIKASYVRSA